MWTPSYSLFKTTLMNMCRMTTPAGHESFTWAQLPIVPYGAAPGAGAGYKDGMSYIDEDSNYIVIIPGKGDRILWASHCDTADDEPTFVHLKVEGEMLSTDGNSILGADDKVGCAIMAMMIRAGVPGTYAFFAGEEIGCVGSKAAALRTADGEFDAVISLDRKGYTSVITHQLGRRCCSDAWAKDLGARIQEHSRGVVRLSPDSTGVYTDSREFATKIRECTNLSVGYFDQHCKTEHANMEFAYELCCALIRIGLGVGIPDPVRSLEDQDEEEDWYGSYRGLYSKFSPDDYELGMDPNSRYSVGLPSSRKDLDSLTDEEWINYMS